MFTGATLLRGAQYGYVSGGVRRGDLHVAAAGEVHARQPHALRARNQRKVRRARGNLLDGEPGGSPFAGRTMTGFSNDEERDAGLADKAPWLLEDRLVALGAKYQKAPEPWASYTTVDGNLYTGQNPASSQELAERLVKDLA